MIIGIVSVLVVAIFLSVPWVNLIDRAVSNDEWEKQRERDRQQEEYIREYNRKQEEKKWRKKHGKNINRK